MNSVAPSSRKLDDARFNVLCEFADHELEARFVSEVCSRRRRRSAARLSAFSAAYLIVQYFSLELVSEGVHHGHIHAFIWLGLAIGCASAALVPVFLAAARLQINDRIIEAAHLAQFTVFALFVTVAYRRDFVHATLRVGANSKEFHYVRGDLARHRLGVRRDPLVALPRVCAPHRHVLRDRGLAAAARQRLCPRDRGGGRDRGVHRGRACRRQAQC
jgi:hypothetical protein